MENGHDVGLNNSPRLPENDNLFQVIKAVEAAETTINVEENCRLKAELERSALDLAKYKSDESLPQTEIKASYAGSSGIVVVHPHVNAIDDEATVSNRSESHSEAEGNITNGIVSGNVDGAGPSQFDSSYTRSLSRMRMGLEGEHIIHINSSTHGSMPVGEVNYLCNAWKQDLIQKVQEHEQEISHLRKYLTECSVKEAQIRNEKYVLEKRIAYMRLAFDQQQQDLVDASAKALSYRQEIIEENIHLTYALQATQEERSSFVSYLLPLLSEYSLQPQVSDAQSIVSNVKVLFKHLQEKLLLTEAKLKQSEYQFSPLENSLSVAPEMAMQPGTSGDKTSSKHVQFIEPPGKVVDQGAGNPSNVSASDDPSSSSSPLLSPVPEEPSSSSDDGHVDPLPAIEDLQISGEPYPGHELQACGYSTNGTTSCNFEWVCHLGDGSVNYIEGAKQPNYLVTADDVDLYLAIEVQPLDDRNRKGELVKVFANENRKIACHPEMQSHIEKTLHSGHASYKVSVATGFLDIWEEATLSIKREGCNIKCNSDLIVAEKFSASTSVTIPFGQPAEFVIVCSDGSEHSLRADNGSTDLSCSRDTIVLTLRLFIMRALQRKKKGKKRVFLFNK